MTQRKKTHQNCLGKRLRAPNCVQRHQGGSISTLPAPPAVPAAAEPTPAGAPKKAVAKPATSVPPAKAAAKAASTKPALKAPATSASKPLAKAFAPAKPAVKPAKAAQKAAPPEKPAKAPKPTATPSAKPAKPAKPPKVKKPKLVRDRFTATEDDMAVLRALKQRAGKLDMPVKKGTVLRAGVRALTALSDTALVALLKQVPALK